MKSFKQFINENENLENKYWILEYWVINNPNSLYKFNIDKFYKIKIIPLILDFETKDHLTFKTADTYYSKLYGKSTFSTYGTYSTSSILIKNINAIPTSFQNYGTRILYDSYENLKNGFELMKEELKNYILRKIRRHKEHIIHLKDKAFDELKSRKSLINKEIERNKNDIALQQELLEQIHKMKIEDYLK